jgi:hypothetical protein
MLKTDDDFHKPQNIMKYNVTENVVAGSLLILLSLSPSSWQKNIISQKTVIYFID